MTRKVRKKPAPPSRKLSKRRPPAPKAGEASAGINEVSPITAEQMARAEGDIKSLRKDVKTLAKRPPPTIKVEAPTSQVVLPDRPRITKISIHYDTLGMPDALIPQYSDSAV